MATISDYREQIASEFMSSENVQRLYNFDGSKTFDQCFPAVSVEGVFIYLWAFGAWVLSTMYEKHRSDVLADLAALKPHTLRWYVTKAKSYQHGVELPKDHVTGQYVSDVYTEEKESARRVHYAVAQEVNGSVYLKVAKYTNANNHTPCKLSDDELKGLKRYFSQIKDAGVPMALISNDPDVMTVNITIYYNPIKLQENSGILVDDSGTDVVRDAIEQVIENLPFNGDCKNSDILDAVKNLDGIDVADVTLVRSKPANGTYKNIVGYCTPESGYFKLESLTLTLKPYSYGNEI